MVCERHFFDLKSLPVLVLVSTLVKFYLVPVSDKRVWHLNFKD